MKKILILLVLLSIRVASFAQESTITQQNNSYTAFVANTFQNVNMSYVPTGFLMDKAFPMTNPDYWTGTTALTDSTNMDLGRFSPLYLMLQSAKVGTQSFPDFDAFSTVAPSTSSATLALLYCKYNKFRTDAVTANLMSVQNNQLFDVAGRTQSPYVEKEVFAATALQYDFSSSTISFTLPSAKVVSNINANITTLTVDWGDGLGNRAYSVGQTVSISYSTPGKKLITVNYTKPDGSVLKSRFEISVSSIDVTLRSCTDPNYTTTCINERTIVADRAYLGVAASAKVTISFACADQKLRKPFIILDGFDPDFFINSTTFNDVLKIMEISNSPTGNQLGIDLKAAGYDLVFID